MQAARKAGVQISFDCNFRARLWGSRAAEAPQLLTRLCEQADVIFGDDRDIAFMLGFKASAADARREAADVAFKTFKHLRYIVCTERARHSVDVQQLTGLLFDSKNTYTSRSYPLHSIVDRIGGGDAFAAGVLHGLLTGMSPQASIDFGAAAGCLKHSIPGDFNLLGVSDVELLLCGERRRRPPLKLLLSSLFHRTPGPLCELFWCADRAVGGGHMYEFKRFYIDGAWVTPPGRRELAVDQSGHRTGSRQDHARHGRGRERRGESGARCFRNLLANDA